MSECNPETMLAVKGERKGDKERKEREGERERERERVCVCVADRPLGILLDFPR